MRITVERNKLLSIIEEQLDSQAIKDYSPNGLQVEGSNVIRKIITGVTATQALIDCAIEKGADTILVHHGYFWKGEASVITGMKKQRLAKLLAHDINLVAYHLPLDIHPQLGNNAQLGKMLGLRDVKIVPDLKPHGIVMYGDLPHSLSHQAVNDRLSDILMPNHVVSVGHGENIRRLAWCTGGGQSFIDQVASISVQHSLDIDAFVSGEISEQTTHSALEQGIDFFAAGHHATERYGIKALGEWLSQNYDLNVEFVDIDNPA